MIIVIYVNLMIK